MQDCITTKAESDSGPGYGPEIHELRVEMARRAWDARALARHAGVHYRTLQNVLYDNNRCRPVRAAVNQALGRQIFDLDRLPRPRRQSVINPKGKDI